MISSKLFIITILPAAIYSQEISLSIKPEPVIIYFDKRQWNLNFDFWIKNISEQDFQLTYLELKVYNEENQLILKKHMSQNGLPGSLSTIDTSLKSKGDLYLFNPFHTLPEYGSPSKFIYTFYFGDNPVEIQIKPRQHNPLTKLEIPMEGKIFIDDGNDYYSHHRRVSLNSEAARDLGMNSIAQRFALDFTRIDDNGDRRKPQLNTNSDWYGWRAKVFAPGDGVIVGLRKTVPDNQYVNGSLVYSEEVKSGVEKDISAGNYVLIDHQNGEYSLLCHFKEGSILPDLGDNIQSGDLLGEVGLSGDTYYPHLHYQLMDSSDIIHSEGLPIQFQDIELVNGKKIKEGYLNSGDIIQIKKL